MLPSGQSRLYHQSLKTDKISEFEKRSQCWRPWIITKVPPNSHESAIEIEASFPQKIPMPLPQIDSDTYERRRGGGVFSLFGLPFFIAGLAIIVVAFIPREVRGGDEFPLYIAIPFGGIFVLVGAGILFGRSATIIDRKKGEVRQWWGILKPIREKVFSLEDINQVSLRTEIRRSDKSSYTVYPVRLRGEKDAEIKLSEERQLKKGRQDAEEIAKFLSLPIYDETGGEMRIREPDTLDVSFRERFREGIESNEIPDTPKELKSKIEYDASTLTITTKPIGFTPVLLIAIIGLASFELFAFGFVFRPIFQGFNNEIDPIFVIFAVAFATIPTLVIGSLVARSFMAHDIVTTDSNGITVNRKIIFSKSIHIPAEELEELFIKNVPGNDSLAAFGLNNRSTIRARSDNHELTFGVGVSAEELAYLLALTKAALVA